MIRKEIIKRINKLNLRVLKWQDCNAIWNDLYYQYGISENDFWSEIDNLISEGNLIVKDKKDPYPQYYLSEDFLNSLDNKG